MVMSHDLHHVTIVRHWPGIPASHAPAGVTSCKSCDMTVKFSPLKKAVRDS